MASNKSSRGRGARGGRGRGLRVIAANLLAAVFLLGGFGWARSASAPKPGAPAPVLTGAAAFGDWSADAPGVRRHITAADLPLPYATESAVNPPEIAERPKEAWPKVPAGFKAALYADGLDGPRIIRVAPNGDIFVAESFAGRVTVLRPGPDPARPAARSAFAGGLNIPHGIAFYPPGPNARYVYIADTDAVLRYPYENGDLKARGKAETIVSGIPTGGHHITRDVVFSSDGAKMFVSVGSASNVQEGAGDYERLRADILEYNPDGSGFRIYATGIRNPVGLAIEPLSGALWCSVNERDALGDDLAPDYITHVAEGGFYGWPWFYIGANQDPRHPGAHPELKSRVLVPDVLLQAHSASMEMVFYSGSQFPARYQGDIFAAEHGSWNRSRRTGYKIIHVPLKRGVAIGEYEDFMTGFVNPAGKAWGRPFGVAVAKDGSLLVADDTANVIWRVSFAGK